MGLSATAYQRMLLALFPPGKLRRLIGDGLIPDLLLGSADELARVDVRAEDLLEESVPSNADEMLEEYEAELELPATGTGAERLARVVSRYLARQRYRPADLQLALAPILGLATADVAVIERSVALAVSTGDGREVFQFFVYRNPALAGSYDVEDAQALLDSIKPSNTDGDVIESIDFLCDDPYSLCDRDIIESGGGGGPPPNVLPVANYSWVLNAGRQVQFTDSSSDSDGTIASWLWDFGDATSSTSASPSKTYAAGGIYTVQLTVTDNAGGTNSISKTVYVWQKDATSLIGVPESAADWTAVLAACGIVLGNPMFLWRMQEASGNLADSIGSFVGTASGTGATYQQAVTGWSRLGIATTDGATFAITNTDAGLPSIATDNFVVMIYARINSAPGTYRNVMQIGTSPGVLGYVKSGPELQLAADANGSVLSGVNPTGAVRPFVIQHNESTSQQRWFTDQEKLTVTFAPTVTGKQVKICGGTNGAAAATTIYAAGFGAGAGGYSDAQMKLLLQTLGWTIPWT